MTGGAPDPDREVDMNMVTRRTATSAPTPPMTMMPFIPAMVKSSSLLSSPVATLFTFTVIVITLEFSVPSNALTLISTSPFLTPVESHEKFHCLAPVAICQSSFPIFSSTFWTSPSGSVAVPLMVTVPDTSVLLMGEAMIMLGIVFTTVFFTLRVSITRSEYSAPSNARTFRL